MSLYYSDKIKSTNTEKYGIVDSSEVSGHKRVNSKEELYKIPDAILSQSGNNTDNDALGNEWFVYEENIKYTLINWELRGESNGWEKSSVDLSNYYTKDEINDKGYITQQVQPDWNETDSTSAAYIANKPFEKTTFTDDIFIPNGEYLVKDVNQPSILIGDDLYVSYIHLTGGDPEIRFSTNSSLGTNSVGRPMLTVEGKGIVFNASGDGTKFLSDDGSYKTLYSTDEIDAKLGDINTILESIING